MFVSSLSLFLFQFYIFSSLLFSFFVCVSHFLLLEKRVTRQLIVVVRFLMKHERLPKHRRLAFFQFLPLIWWIELIFWIFKFLTFFFRLAWNLLSWTNIYSPQKFSGWKKNSFCLCIRSLPFRHICNFGTMRGGGNSCFERGGILADTSNHVKINLARERVTDYCDLFPPF